MRKLGISTEEEFLGETRIGFFSSSKPKFRDLDQEIWLGKSPGKSHPELGETLNTEIAKFWYSRYIPRLAKYQKLKISRTEYKILMNTVSKGKPLILYILGDMISPS